MTGHAGHAGHDVRALHGVRQGAANACSRNNLQVRLGGCGAATAVVVCRMLLQALPDPRAQRVDGLCRCCRGCNCRNARITWAAAAGGHVCQVVQGAQQRKEVLHGIPR